MKIVSTNISEIKTVEYEGELITTGIFKKPTAATVYIDSENIHGDAQADLVNHGGVDKAVYAFCDSYYEYWKTQLKNPELTFGDFGENFTVTNLHEDQIYIGEHYQLGSAILEVSQPRVPCFKLGMALNNKKLPKLFIQNFATGVYFRVVERGNVTTGDEIKLVKPVDHKVSVRTLFKAFFDKNFENREEIYQQAVDVPELANEWREKLVKRLAGIDAQFG